MYIILLERVNVENKTVILFMRSVDVFAFYFDEVLRNVISVTIQCIKAMILLNLISVTFDCIQSSISVIW